MSKFRIIACGLLVAAAVADLGATGAMAARRSRGRSSNGYKGYLSPTGPSSRYNEFRIPFYMRADRRVLGLLP